MREASIYERFDDTVISVLIAIGSLFLGITIAFIKWHSAPEGDVFINGLIFTFTTAVVGYTYRIWIRLSRNFATTQRLEGDLVKAMSSSEEHIKDSNTVQNILEFESVIRNTSLRIMEYKRDFLQANGNAVSVDTRNMTIFITREFWHELTELQKSFTKSRPIPVKITHSTSIELWEGKDAGAALIQQRRFIAEGGNIVRIIEGMIPRDVLFSGKDEGELAEKYRKVIKIMEDYGITVKYVEGFHESSQYDFTWVQLSEVSDYADISMVWTASPNARMVTGCSLRTNNISEIETGWEYLEEIYKSQTEQE